MTEDVLKKIRRLRTRLQTDLLELDALEELIPKPTPEPVKPRKRHRDKIKQQLVENEASGTWRKPVELKKSKPRQK